jgi:glycogen phosphorylase
MADVSAPPTRKKRPTLWRNAESVPDVDSIKQAFVRHLQSSLGRDEYSATALDRYHALCLTVRDSLVERWVNTQQTYYHANAKRVYYLSLEYLMGRALHNAMCNLGYLDQYRKAMDDLGYSLEELEELEVDAGLGNGGLGRLAACYLDSMATLQLPGYGYGLRYDYGIFRQEILDGRQIEEPDDWLRFPYPWEIARPEYVLMVRFGGRLETHRDQQGAERIRWVDTQNVLATAYDTPIPGFGNHTVNTLRLWRARATHDFDLDDFNQGHYIAAVEHKTLAENITRVLYPNDNFYLGQELRLRQQYFLVSATIQDTVRRHLVNHPNLDEFADKAVFQLNDTHPALAVAELMRILLDVYGYSWERAWKITSSCMAYTNHTLLPEALEKWSADMIGRLLPRHLLIINEINQKFLDEVRQRFPGDPDLARRVSIYEEGQQKRVRMAHLAVVGSKSVNGVAALHTELLRSRVLPDFNQIWPERFNNKTNGVTPRRWLLSCNPWLAGLLSRRLGGFDWAKNLDDLQKLVELADDPTLIEELAQAKAAAKERLSGTLRWQNGFEMTLGSIFDVQIKRIHEYKRQLLNVLHIIHLYRELQRNPDALRNPHTFLFGGKAAPGYFMAKLIIRLINDVGAVVNSDPAVAQKLRVYFIPNYSVTLGEILFPGADVSEQISTAGFEASGTGNMKFAMNGALTLGTLDGANVEIADAVGRQNIFIFGNTVEQVEKLHREGYQPHRLYEENPRIREVIDLIRSGHFSPGEPQRYQPIVDALLGSDYYLHLADFEMYREAHQAVDRAYCDQRAWFRSALLNIANMGKFSSDRAVAEYNRDIWHTQGYSIEVE